MEIESIHDAAPPDEIEAAPEAPQTDATGLAESDSPEGDESGIPRDERGRFAPRTQAPEQSDDDSETEVDADAEPADEEADSPDAPSAETQTAPPPEPEQAGTPFTVPHRGQQYTLQGAHIAKDGSLRVEPTVVPRLQQMLARAREHEVMTPRMQQQMREMEAALQARHQGVELLEQILTAEDELEATRAFLGLRQQWPQMQLEARQAELDAREQALRGGQQAPGADAQQMIRLVVDSTAQHLADLRTKVPELRGLTEQDMQQLMPQLTRRAQLYVRGASVEDEMTYGVPQGTPVVDIGELAQLAIYHAAPILRARAGAEAKRRADAARAKARQVNQGKTATVNAPPAAKTKVVAPPATKPGQMTKEEWERVKNGG